MDGMNAIEEELDHRQLLENLGFNDRREVGEGKDWEVCTVQYGSTPRTAQGRDC